MGGTVIAADRREAASALRWWLEMGVDVAIQESPRDWFDADTATAAAPAEDLEAAEPAALPDTLEAFQKWLSTSPDAPLASSRSKPVLPHGSAGAEVMIIAEPPTRDELASAQPIGGEAGLLMQRMLAAIGMADGAYSANLACFHSGTRLSEQEAEQCASAARHHVALANPKRLLLVGEIPCRAILGKPLVQARGHVHQVEGVRTVATFHPRQLLKRPSDKSLAWKDLLLLAEDSR